MGCAGAKGNYSEMQARNAYNFLFIEVIDKLMEQQRKLHTLDLTNLLLSFIGYLNFRYAPLN